MKRTAALLLMVLVFESAAGTAAEPRKAQLGTPMPAAPPPAAADPPAVIFTTRPQTPPTRMSSVDGPLTNARGETWNPPQEGWGWYVGAAIAVKQFDLSGDQQDALGWALAPEITLGWRSPYGRALQIEYRTFAIDDESSIASALALMRNHRRIDFQQLDVEVEFQESPPFLFFQDRWEVGLRGVSLFYDTQARAMQHPGTTFGEYQHFLGLGPHANWRVRWTLADTGLHLFGEADGAILIGAVDGYRGSSSHRPDLPSSRDTSNVAFQGIVRAGLGWLFPEENRLLRVKLGYELEAVSLRRIGAEYDFTRTNIIGRGFFLRAEFRF